MSIYSISSFCHGQDTNDENEFNLDNQYFNEMEQAAQIADIEQCLVEHEHFEIAATFGTKQLLNSYTLTIDIDDALGEWPGPLTQFSQFQSVGNQSQGYGMGTANTSLDPHSIYASGGVGGGAGVRDLFTHQSHRSLGLQGGGGGHGRRRSQSQPAPPMGFTTNVSHGILGVEPPSARPQLSSKMFTLSDIVQESRSPRASPAEPRLGRFTSFPSINFRANPRMVYHVDMLCMHCVCPCAFSLDTLSDEPPNY